VRVLDVGGGGADGGGGGRQRHCHRPHHRHGRRGRAGPSQEHPGTILGKTSLKQLIGNCHKNVLHDDISYYLCCHYDIEGGM
jgi:hypothetical protein